MKRDDALKNLSLTTPSTIDPIDLMYFSIRAVVFTLCMMGELSNFGYLGVCLFGFFFTN